MDRTRRGFCLAWVVAQLGLVGNACAPASPSALPIGGKSTTAGECAAPRSGAQRSDDTTASGAGSQNRPRLSLPSAAAVLSTVTASSLSFSSTKDRPPSIDAILGHNARVWLLGGSALYASDGRIIRLEERTICVADPESVTRPDFDTLELDGGTLKLLGGVGGGCGVAAALAVRIREGVWRCEQSPGESFGLRHFWSSGELITVSHNSDESTTFATEALRGELSPIRTPIAVARGGVHAWALVAASEGAEAHLVEWTGVRWRERSDALPGGVFANDIVAMTIDDGGHYYLATRFVLLVSDGNRFVARAVPRGFEPESMVATQVHGLWALGGKRAWHYDRGAWSYAELPMAHVESEWLTPEGILWVGGSNDVANTPGSSDEAAATQAVVVTLVLAGQKARLQ